MSNINWSSLSLEKRNMIDPQDIKEREKIQLGDQWWAAKLPMFSGPHAYRVYHKCGEFYKYGMRSEVSHPMIKNTHKIRGVNYRCQRCKRIAPPKVLLWLKLQKLHEKVND